jgi:putative endonuclease
MFYVYVIKCKEGKFYIGSTEDIEKRLFQHNNKLFKAWTNRYADWKVVYSESFNDRKSAILREKEIKKMKGGNSFRSLIGS